MTEEVGLVKAIGVETTEKFVSDIDGRLEEELVSGRWEVIKGNSSVRDFGICDKKGNLVENLASAAEIKFQLKLNKKSTLVQVEKTIGSGLEVDVPSMGYLRITLTPTDTGEKLFVGDYFMALRIKQNVAEVYEIKMKIGGVETEKFRVKQNIIQ